MIALPFAPRPAAATLAAIATGLAGTLVPPPAGAQTECAGGFAGAFPCDRVDLLAVLSPAELGGGPEVQLNDVWGWTDPETGREYALVGRADGTAFVDVTDPLGPRYLGHLPATAGSRPSKWRDMKVFRDHMFVVAGEGGRHGMQIFDLRQLAATGDVARAEDAGEARVFAPAATYEGVDASHNIAINEATGFAYLVGSAGEGETCGGGSHIVDIGDPPNAAFAGCFAHVDTGRRRTGYTHDAHCVLYRGPDDDYAGREICVGGNETAFSIADVTDKSNPVPLAEVAYPHTGYAHQGWLSEDHRYLYANDELDELVGRLEGNRTLIFDLSVLTDPVLVAEHFGPTAATTHNLYVRGERLYMANNFDGLVVLDLADPETPVETGRFDTTPADDEESGGFGGAWSVYPFLASGTLLVSSRREGLFLLRQPAADRAP